MIDPHPNDDLLRFTDEDELHPATPQGTWRVLIVDDDDDVHASTVFALSGLEIHHRPLELLHAHSAAQARSVLESETDIAAILLDVVMEEDNAGLRLVRVIREELGLTETRIILRTGQPGYAPEIEAVREYDINDYKTKSELTRVKLFTTITAAIRSYEQIRAINTSRRGLDQIVRASSELMALHGLQSFASGVITQITGLLGMPPESLVCAKEWPQGQGGECLVVIAAAGKFEMLVNNPVSAIAEPVIRDRILSCMAARHNLYETEATVLFFRGRAGRDMATYLDLRSPLSPIDRQLLEVFSSNIAVGLDNVEMFGQLNDFAFFDTLTGLPNRRRFLGLIEERLNHNPRASQILALVDLDHFSETNDAFGHHLGDQLIRAVAARLTEQLGQVAALARISADLFGVFGSETHIHPERLLGLFKTSFDIDGEPLRISASVGLVRMAEVEGTPSEAIKDANIALKRAKSKHRGQYHYFTREMGVDIRERVRLLHSLRTAFEFDRLFVVYQPQVSMDDGRPLGAEALLRWRADDGQFIPPDRFIPLAEYSGLIISLGEWVLRTACHEQVRLKKEGFHNFRIAVNVSVSQIRDLTFIDALNRALVDSGADPAWLELEITESIAMENADTMSETLEAIKHLGISISVDDFGTGYSSLSQLRRLQVDRLKIDKAFVDEISDAHPGGRIAEMIVQLGCNLGLDVIAEGVETEIQARVLRDMGCHEAQGYLYARPMPPEQHLAWLREQGV